MKDKERLIEAHWDEAAKGRQKYEAHIKILAKDRNFLLTDLVTCISQYKANLMAVNSSVNQENLLATTKMTIVVDDVEHLKTIMANLKKVESVLEVDRVIK